MYKAGSDSTVNHLDEEITRGSFKISMKVKASSTY